ncbi:hypothetical protein CHARACLAT_032874 [Characodon lateralis]|uniref:Uncharacterized protein n=1 Tax=Characodon lateralis TaxID=208331 RepID=A0ABU7DLT7_9TELE|nr:hypothetical protein [Characodon lateralis]
MVPAAADVIALCACNAVFMSGIENRPLFHSLSVTMMRLGTKTWYRLIFRESVLGSTDIIRLVPIKVSNPIPIPTGHTELFKFTFIGRSRGNGSAAPGTWDPRNPVVQSGSPQQLTLCNTRRLDQRHHGPRLQKDICPTRCSQMLCCSHRQTFTGP